MNFVANTLGMYGMYICIRGEIGKSFAATINKIEKKRFVPVPIARSGEKKNKKKCSKTVTADLLLRVIVIHIERPSCASGITEFQLSLVFKCKRYVGILCAKLSGYFEHAATTEE